MSVSNDEIVKTVVLDFAKMELRSDGIVNFLPSIQTTGLNSNQIEEVYQALLSLTQNKPAPLYVDLKTHIRLNSEEKSLIILKLATCITACAIKEDNIMIRFVVHAFNHLYKPAIPIKMFKTEEEAIVWLKEF